LKTTFLEALAAPQGTVLSKKPGAWRGSVPYLRLILCLTEDDVKKEFLVRDRAMSRTELDGRHSDVRQPSVYELMADMWNNPDYNPVLPVYTVHSDYRAPTDCGYLKVRDMIRAEPEKVKDILSGMRANLNRIILDWETSGQGDGGNLTGFENDDRASVASEEDGILAKRSPAALNCRASFLQGKPSYLLIYWEICDDHQLLSSALGKISKACSAEDGNKPPAVITTGKLRGSPTMSVATARSTDFRIAIQEFGHHQSLIAFNHRIDVLRDKKRDYRLMMLRATTDEEKEFCRDEIILADSEIDQCKKQAREAGQKIE
jgi:hypothetical protein